jgi:hypothetical protein
VGEVIFTDPLRMVSAERIGRELVAIRAIPDEIVRCRTRAGGTVMLINDAASATAVRRRHDREAIVPVPGSCHRGA